MDEPKREKRPDRDTVRLACAGGTLLGGMSRLVAEVLHHCWN